MEVKYFKRCIEEKIQSSLRTMGGVYIKGIKNCGKTMTCEQYAKSVVYLDDPITRELNHFNIQFEVHEFLNKEAPLLVDEWQEEPTLWDAIRYQIDRRKLYGQFILTSSTSLPPRDQGEIRHSGIGRIENIEMMPMSLWESGNSSGKVSLLSLFNDKSSFTYCENLITVKEMANLICIGGWPGTLGLEGTDKMRIVKSFFESLVQSDMSKYDGRKRDAALAREILKSLARNVSTSAFTTTIIDDVKANVTVSDVTVEAYINVLKELYIIMELPNWGKQLRSKSMLKQSHTKYFTDPSLACVALSITPNKLLEDFPTFGLLFENLCIRDLKVYSSSIDANIFKYQDFDNLEVDTIVELDDGRWGAFEIKLGDSEFDKAARNLLKLNGIVLKQGRKGASFLAILTGTRYGFVREDGILVIPIGCLKD